METQKLSPTHDRNNSSFKESICNMLIINGNISGVIVAEDQ